MLYSFKKYYYSTRINHPINTIKRNFFVVSSTFFRRSYFRSLITYINILYTNIDQPVSNNFFYLYNFIIVQYNTNNPGLYFKKIIIR